MSTALINGKVNWTNFMDKNAKFLTPQQREYVLGVSGYHSINPLVLIDELMVENESNPAASKMNDQAFLLHLEEMANKTEIVYEETESATEKPKSNSATSALWNLMGKNDSKLDDFVSKYNKLFDNTGLSHSDFDDNSDDGVGNRQYQGMQWPWQGSLKTGACHTSTGYGYIPAALDPQNGARWGGNGQLVTAAHSGRVFVYASCGLKISGSGFQTGYYHLDNIRVRNGASVTAGQVIANAANNIRQALCRGGWSSGPHLHFGLFDYSGRGRSFNNQIISGYRINARITRSGNYEWNCSNCNFVKGGRRYCPQNRIQ